MPDAVRWSLNTHRLNQTVCTALVYESLAGWRWHPHAGEGLGLTGVPAWTSSCWKAGRAVAPQRLTGTGGFVHQDHRRVDELAPAPWGGNYSWNRSDASCCCVHPGGGGHGGHAAGPGVQAVLGLREERRRWAKRNTVGALTLSVCVLDLPVDGIWMEMCSRDSFLGWGGCPHCSVASDTGS